MQQPQPSQMPMGGMVPPQGPGQGGPSPLMAALGAGPVQQRPMAPVAGQPGDLGPLLQMFEQLQAQGVPPQALLAMLGGGQGGPPMAGGMAGMGQGMPPGPPPGGASAGLGY